IAMLIKVAACQFPDIREDLRLHLDGWKSLPARAKLMAFRLSVSMSVFCKVISQRKQCGNISDRHVNF
ncbi:MAG: hypothetical protein ABI863_16640, partial [Ginsengibacter sp.]